METNLSTLRMAYLDHGHATLGRLLEELQVLAGMLVDVRTSDDVVLEEIGEFLALLRGELWTHAEHEETVLFPEITARVSDRAVVDLVHQHDDLKERVDHLTNLVETATSHEELPPRLALSIQLAVVDFAEQFARHDRDEVTALERAFGSAAAVG